MSSPSAPAVVEVRTNAAALLPERESGVFLIKTETVPTLCRQRIAVNGLRRHHTLLVMVSAPEWNQDSSSAVLVVVYLTGDFKLHTPTTIPMIHSPHTQGSGVVRVVWIPVNMEPVADVVVAGVGPVTWVTCLLDAVHVGEGLAAQLASR